VENGSKKVNQEPSVFTLESVVGRLRSEGMRITKGRKAILELLFEAEGPLTLNEIQKRASQRTTEKPDYATVFRMMTTLEGLRLAHKVNLRRACSYYELRNPTRHYDHLVCRDCGRVEILDMPCPVKAAELEITRRYGFSRLTHSLEFFGCCPECDQSKRGRATRSQPAKRRAQGRPL
jgi:Fur family ferric uptake transcriptional regulator